MSTLVLCSACQRHFRPHDPVCPFCGGRARAPETRLTPLLSAGASRSRRYAASAAFIASSAMFACGEGSSADPGVNGDGATGGQSQGGRGGASQKSTGGSVQSGGAGTQQGEGGAGQGEAGDTQQSTGGTSNAGSGGAVQSTGGTSSKGGSSGAASTGRACEGFPERGSCRSAADCQTQPGSIGPVMCLQTPPTPGCPGNPTFFPSCPDGGCGDGMFCAPMQCGSQCQATCDPEVCTGENQCVGDYCRPKPCDEDGAKACPENYVCDAADTRFPDHCVPVSCNDGVECQPWKQCGAGAPLDPFSCGPKSCRADTDCGECGYCVGEQCQPTLGTCYQNIAMPYGCVWPDEELI